MRKKKQALAGAFLLLWGSAAAAKVEAALRIIAEVQGEPPCVE